jgi:NIMA (never in mitosis gene a)-related kinase
MDQYQEIRLIGRGNYGTAVLVKDKVTQKRLVVKKIPLVGLTEKERMDAMSECKLLSRMSHPNVIEFVASFVEGDTLHLVTSFCDGGDLTQLIKQRKEEGLPMTEDEVMDVFVQLAMAVDFIHSVKIMHRDLKSGNVFLTQKGVVKLGDFGIAKMLDTSMRHAQTVVGTPFYMSPEVCENKPYDFKSDVWAMGCILYEMCTFEHAFDSSNLLGLVVKIVQDPVGPIPDMYSEDVKALVKLLLQKDPAERPSLRKLFALPFVHTRLEKLARNRALPVLDADPVSGSPKVRSVPPSPGGGDDGTPKHRRESSLSLAPPIPFAAGEEDAHRPRHRREWSSGGPGLSKPSLGAQATLDLKRATSQELPPSELSSGSSTGGSGMRRSSSVMGNLGNLGHAGGATSANGPPASPSAAQNRLDVLGTPKKPAGSKHSRSRSSIQFDHNTPALLADEFASSSTAQAAERLLRSGIKPDSPLPNGDELVSAQARSRSHSRTDSSLPSIGTRADSMSNASAPSSVGGLNDSGKKMHTRRSSLELL